MKSRKKVLNAVLGLSALGVVTLGGAFAYLTDMETVANVFTVGSVVVDLIEKNNPYDAVVVPRQKIDISSYAVNSGANDAVVFMEVIVPTIREADVVDDAGRELSVYYPEEYPESYTGNNRINMVDFMPGSIAGWELIADRSYDGDGNYSSKSEFADFRSYVYGYNTKLRPGEETTRLFEGGLVVNFTEEFAEPYGSCLEIPVRVYAIQADYVVGSDGIVSNIEYGLPGFEYGWVNPISVDTDYLYAENLRYIFNTFMNQNYDKVTNNKLNHANESGKLDIKGNLLLWQ